MQLFGMPVTQTQEKEASTTGVSLCLSETSKLNQTTN